MKRNSRSSVEEGNNNTSIGVNNNNNNGLTESETPEADRLLSSGPLGKAAPPAGRDGADHPKDTTGTPKEGEEEEEGPDGGWGWMVVAGCFLIWFILGAASAIFGLLFVDFLTEHETSSTVTAWIHNLGFMLSCYCTYMLDPLVEEYGWRKVTFVMGVMRALGLALSAFTPNAAFLFFSYTIFAGIPIDVLYSMTFAIIPHYFTKGRSFANSLMSVGASLSLLVLPLLVAYLENNFGFMGAGLITAAVNLNLCVAAMVFHPVEWHYKKRPPPIVKAKQDKPREGCMNHFGVVFKSMVRVAETAKANMSLLKSPRVIIVSMFCATNLLGLTNFEYMVPFAIQAAGHSLDHAGLCFTVSGVCLLITRILHPFLAMLVSHKTIVIVGSSILATSVTVFAWVESLLVKGAMMGAFGCGTGLVFASYNLVMVEVLGLPLLQPVLSITGLFNGLLFLVFGPFIGFVRDLSGSYAVSMSVLAGLLYCSVLLWAFLPAATAFDRRAEERKEDEKAKQEEKLRQLQVYLDQLKRQQLQAQTPPKLSNEKSLLLPYPKRPAPPAASREK